MSTSLRSAVAVALAIPCFFVFSALLIGIPLPLPLSTAQRAEFVTYAPAEGETAVFQDTVWKISDNTQLIEVVLVNRGRGQVSVIRYLRLHLLREVAKEPPPQKQDRQPSRSNPQVFT